jgi:hypothetical protein
MEFVLKTQLRDDQNRIDEVFSATSGCNVLSIGLNIPPTSNTVGDTYVIGSSPTGAWAGNANQVARWSANTNSWLFSTVSAGWFVVESPLGVLYTYNGTTWASSEMVNPMTAVNDLLIGGTGGIPTRLAAGANQQVLAVNGSSLAWMTVSSVVLGTAMSNPMTALNDLIVGGSAGVPARLGIGSNGQFLGISSGGNITWMNPSSGFASPMTTLGDMIYSNDSSGTAARLAIGTNGQILTVNSGGVPVWATASAGFVNPMTTMDDLIIGGGGGSPARLAEGSEGQVLTISSGHVTWTTPVIFNNPMTTAADLIVGGTSGAPARLAKGSNNQVLTVSSGALAWANPTGMANPMTSLNDLIIGGSSGVPFRLAGGSNNQILGISSGAVAWIAAPTSGMANPMTSLGDMVYSINNSGVPGKLQIGTDGMYLSISGGIPAWITGPGASLSNPMTTQYDLLVGGTGGAPARLGVGTAGQVLGVSSGGALTWTNQTPLTTAGDIFVGGTGGASARLGIGTNGQVLGIASGSLAWVAQSGSILPSFTGANNGQVLGIVSDATQWVSIPAPAIPAMMVLTTQSVTVTPGQTLYWEETVTSNRMYGVSVASSTGSFPTNTNLQLQMFGNDTGGTNYTNLMYSNNFTDVLPSDTTQGWYYRDMAATGMMRLSLTNNGASSITCSFIITTEPF